MRLLLAILLPWLQFFTIGRPFAGIICLILQVTIIGLMIAILLGTTFAVIMNLSKGMERALFPYAVVLQTVPILAITPLLTQLFGERMGVRLVVTVLIARVVLHERLSRIQQAGAVLTLVCVAVVALSASR